MMIADVFAKAIAAAAEDPAQNGSLDFLLIMLFYTIEIYFDFSGYSDMAAGSAMMLNITLPINFDSPYKALSIRDFWKRWHISLTQFFTKYVYIPLGGNRRGVVFTYVNTMIVFIISGFWHGANWTFVLWGVLHGALSVLDRIFEKYYEKVWKPIRWTFTFLWVNILWLLFSSDSVVQWIKSLLSIVKLQNLHVREEIQEAFNIVEGICIADLLKVTSFVERVPGFWMLVYIFLSMACILVPKNNYRMMHKKTMGIMVLSALAFVWGVLSLNGEAAFIYLNF